MSSAGSGRGLQVSGLSKAYGSAHGQMLFQGLSFCLDRGDRLAVLGRNGQGKSTLIKILGGVLPQTSGSLNWTMQPSWPIGFSGGFQGGLTGLDNIRFIARLYDKDINTITDKTEAFAELGDALYMPAKHYSSGMRARLAFGLSLAIEFDCYLIDEVIAVGDVNFQKKCHDELFSRRADRAFIIASHGLNFLRDNCDRALIIEGGRAKMFEDVSVAIDIYVAICKRSQDASQS